MTKFVKLSYMRISKILQTYMKRCHYQENKKVQDFSYGYGQQSFKPIFVTRYFGFLKKNNKKGDLLQCLVKCMVYLFDVVYIIA